jgi:hypothetical protein
MKPFTSIAHFGDLIAVVLPLVRAEYFRVHDSLLHDFVRVAGDAAISNAGSTRTAASRPASPAISGIEPVPMALSSRTAYSIRRYIQPHVDFPALPPKAAGTPGSADRTEQAP